MGGAAGEDEDAVEDEGPGSWESSAATIAAIATSRPATRIQRIPARYVLGRAGRLEVASLVHDHAVRSASVGDIRAARRAGSRPAIAPIAIADAMPPAHASSGTTTAQPSADA